TRLIFLIFHYYRHLRNLPSFPTRRSSDLIAHPNVAPTHFEKKISPILYKMHYPEPLFPDRLHPKNRALFDRMYHSYQWKPGYIRSEEHTSELQSRFDLVCRLLLEKKKNTD